MNRTLMGKVTDGLKSAGQAVADAMTPKPIKAGDKLIIPSTDPSMPPVVVPVRKRARRKTAGRRTRPAAKTSRSSARKTKVTKRTAARKPARRAAAKRPRKTARR
jgi:hypothetical protein